MSKQRFRLWGLEIIMIYDTVYNDALQEDGIYDLTDMYSNFNEDLKKNKYQIHQ